MHQFLPRVVCLFCAMCFWLAMPARAEEAEQEALRTEVDELRDRVDDLKTKRRVALERAVDKYLDSQETWMSAEGGDWRDAVAVTFETTAVFQATLGLDPGDRHAVSGRIDLNFDIDITETLDLFLHFTGNTDVNVDVGPATDINFLVQNGASVPSGSGFPSMFSGVNGSASVGTRTMSGWMDGIGVDGTQPLYPSQFAVYEAGFDKIFHMGKNDLHVTMGQIDPRTRFMQVEYSDNARRQFLNNLFIDSPSMLWLTDSSGRTVLGIHAAMEFGESLRLDAGWYNGAGEFFTHGQFLFQVSYTGKIGEKPYHVRGFAFVDEFFRDATGDGSSGGGFTFDYSPSAWRPGMGFFVRAMTTSSDLNPVEFDISAGVVLKGVFNNRPDDDFGFAVGFISIAQNTAFGAFPQDTETTVELFYNYVLEGGSMVISPNFQIVSDAGGGLGWVDDTLVLLGIRFYVLF